ncbi:MAG TPA: hypothetical protein VEA69_08010 [Tepidisphaeraceae bacterium]|nr:hypothetical protein [Tepidisphaeraceae bacterium]
MLGIEKIAEKIAGFIDGVKDKKFWALSSALLIACAVFVGGTWWAGSQEFLDQKRISIENDKRLQEAGHAEALFGVFKKAVMATQPPFAWYELKFGGKPFGTTSAVDAQAGIAMCAVADRELADFAGTAAGVMFDDAQYKDFQTRVSQLIAKYRVATTELRLFYELSLDATAPKEKRTSQGYIVAGAIDGCFSESLALIPTAGGLLENKLRHQTNETRAATERLNRWILRFWLTVPATVYILCWIVFAIRAYRRTTKEKSPIITLGG